MVPERVAPIAVACLLVTAAPAHGQAVARLSFEPRPGLAVRSMVEHTATLFLFGMGDLPDSTEAEASNEGVVMRSVVSDSGGYALRLTVDSVSARHRIATALWRRTELPVGRAVWSARVDRQFMPMPPSNADTDSAFAGAAGGLPRISLPGAMVSPGERWRGEAAIPLAFEIPDGLGGRMAVWLQATTISQLDSMAVRGADTLAYITMRGQLTPTQTSSSIDIGGGPAPVESWGELSARLIWSTGWNAFVSGVIRTQVNQRLEAALGSGVEDARIAGVLTSRFRVAP